MKKLLLLGMLALGLSVAAPQSHAQVRVRIGARERLVRPRVGVSLNFGTPDYRPEYRREYRREYGREYIQSSPGREYIQRSPEILTSPDGTIIMNRHDRWRHREWERRRFSRMNEER